MTIGRSASCILDASSGSKHYYSAQHSCLRFLWNPVLRFVAQIQYVILVITMNRISDIDVTLYSSYTPSQRSDFHRYMVGGR